MEIMRLFHLTAVVSAELCIRYDALYCIKSLTPDKLEGRLFYVTLDALIHRVTVN